ncbi:CAP domain-containing protein [Staphylococcus lugdunensis]|nr:MULTISPECIES: CAP domain-containing protein [Staphylococcus]AMG60783.1 secretion protein [Staphylococcus lugdunensis]EKS25704.1 hypothetical protein HMPREF9308_00555 [Staphylococcus lugdunensis ACS-027-V-Sch2]EVI54061.1 hypothetical protein T979_00074 [Staphylococcus lugdunensis UCIM6116]MBM7133420.1 CAP domain-containing protein [Staphylococcus lugdunensis]MCC2084954.1 CAP domain-containing protein [Staphylococcus lugdunensis]
MKTIKKFLSISLILLCIIIIFPIRESSLVVHMQQDVRSFIDQQVFNKEDENEETLKVPQEQPFAVNNVQLNMKKGNVEEKYGKAKRITTNEYGTKWYAYYDGDYQRFVMIAYLDNKVHALYTNQNIITSKSKIKYGTPKQVVRQRLGQPITEMDKQRLRIAIKNSEYDVFHSNHVYTTIFYDKHEQNGVTALMQVSDKMEKRLTKQYAAPSKSLAKSYEMQNVDLINSERKQHQLATLSYSSNISNTARKHSEDMAKHHYFDHTNLDQESPFDRLKADRIEFNAAGENLAYGQVSSIYAHQGLMNSLGHRKNILNEHFNTVGVGVDFNDERQPYWTENYTG